MFESSRASAAVVPPCLYCPLYRFYSYLGCDYNQVKDNYQKCVTASKCPRRGETCELIVSPDMDVCVDTPAGRVRSTVASRWCCCLCARQGLASCCVDTTR